MTGAASEAQGQRRARILRCASDCVHRIKAHWRYQLELELGFGSAVDSGSARCYRISGIFDF